MSQLTAASVTPSAQAPTPIGSRSRLRVLLAVAVLVESSSLAFFLWFLIPRLETLLTALRVDDPSLRLVVSARYGLLSLALCAAIIAPWTLFKSKGMAGTWVLAELSLILLFGHWVLARDVFSYHGGLSSAIRMD